MAHYDDMCKNQLMHEITALRERVSELEKREIEHRGVVEALQESEDKFRCLVERSNVSVYLIQDGVFRYSNACFAQMLGYSVEEMINKITPEDIVLPEDYRSFSAENIRKRLAGEVESIRYEVRLVTKHGEIRYVEAHGSRTTYRGQPAVIGTIVDITDRTHAEEALQQSEEQYRAVFENTGAATVIIEKDTIISLCNGEFERLSGYTRHEIEGRKSWTAFVAAEDMERMVAQHSLRRVDHDQALQRYEFRFVSRTGEIRNIYLVIDTIRGTEKSVASLIDVTERKRAEDALQQVQDMLRIAINQSPSGILIADAPDVRIRIANPAAFAIRGGSTEALTEIAVEEHSRKWQTFYADGTPVPPEELPLSKAILRGEVSRNQEVIIRHEGGEEHWVLANASPVRDAHGTIRAGIVVFHDITERKRAEEALQESEGKFRDLAEKSIAGVYLIQDGIFKYVNLTFAQVFGYTTDEMIGKVAPEDVVFPEDWPMVEENIRKRLSGEMESQHYETRIRTKSQEIKSVEVYSSSTMYQGKPATIGTLLDISERKRTEDELLVTHRRLFDIIEFLPDATMVIDHEGKVIAWNKAIERMTGVRKEDMLGKGDYAYAIPFYGEPRPILVDMILGRTENSRNLYDLATEEGRTISGEVYVPMAYQGKGAFLSGTASPLFDPEGRIIGAIESIRDVTEQKRVERELQESEERYRIAIEGSNDGIAIMKGEKHLYVNQRLVEMFGYDDPNEIIGKSNRKTVHPDDLQLVDDINIRRQKGEPVPSRYEFKGVRKDGTPLYIEVSATNTRYQGDPASLAFLRDITDRKRAEEALRESEAKYRGIFQNAVMGIFRTTPDGRYLSINPAGARMYRYASEEEMMQSVTDMAHQIYVYPEDRKRLKELLEISGFVENFESAHYTSDGSTIWVSINVRVICDNSGAILYYETTSQDITQRKHAEEEIFRERGKLKTLSDNAPFGMVLINREGQFTYVNTKFTDLFGFDISDVPDGRTWFSKAYPDADYRHTVIAAWTVDVRGAKPGERKPRVFTVTCKDGTQKIVSLISSVLVSGEFLMTCEDITEQKRLEAQLIQAQKMEAIGTLAGGIAHDFNNLLMGIQGYASLMMLDLDTRHPHYERLTRIEEQVRSAADLTRQLLGFARGGRYDMQPVDVNEIIRKSSSMFGRTKKELTIHGKYGKDLWTVEGDQGQIEQVLLNLYVNAWHAMPSGGELYLETGNVTLDASLSAPHGVYPGQYVRISVTDTGTGMDEKTRKRIFDPFFTTKEMGRGTGLGLAMVYGIIKGHNGFINVYSEPGHGTTFTLYLPASEKEARNEKPVVPEVLKGSEAILLVDDEPNVLAVSTEILRALGYTVYSMGSGQEALAYYQEMKDHVALIILDMIMPGLSGSETFDRIRELNPSARILLSSGYSLNGQAQEIMNKGCQGFIQKPFDINFISRKIREVLDMTNKDIDDL